MAKQPKARIIIKSGHRIDLKTEVDVVDLRTGKVENLHMPVGAKNCDIDKNIRKLREQLERSGAQVDFCDADRR